MLISVLRACFQTYSVKGVQASFLLILFFRVFFPVFDDVAEIHAPFH